MRGRVSKIGIIFLVMGLCLAGLSVSCFADDKTGDGVDPKVISATATQSFLPVNQSVKLDTLATTDKQQDAARQTTGVFTRIYDANGRFIGFKKEDIVRDSSGRVTSRTTVTYDTEGKQTGKSTLEYSYKFDKNNRVSSVSITNKNGKGEVVWTSEHAYTRDNNNRIVERQATFKNKDGVVFRTAVETYSRNEKGQMTGSTIIRKDGKGDYASRSEFNYKYGDDGKLQTRTQSTFFKDGAKRVESTNFKNGMASTGMIKIFSQNKDGTYKLERLQKIDYS